MFGTADFGHSDIWHFNFALKYFLSEALKNGYLPMWSKDIGTGFPIFGEGQIGMFNLYNLLAFRFLDPIAAFNLGYLVIFITTLIGGYLYSRAIKLNRIAALFIASTFSLSGVFVTQFNHFNLIQAASFLPWLFYLTEKYLQTRKRRWLLAFSFILSQQIYSGFQQIVLITLLGTCLYFITRAIREKINRFDFFRISIYFTFSILAGFILATPQIYASWQLTSVSGRQGGVDAVTMAKYPYLPQYLLTFFNPYLFGDPRIGTYPPLSQTWGIFWESTGYIGIIPFLLILKVILKKRSLDKKLKVILLSVGIVGIFGLVLMLGKSTPFFFLFQLPPLYLFRMPSRFIFLFVWFLCVISGAGINTIKNKVIASVIFLLAISQLILFGATYNPIIKNTNEWLSRPETARIISQDKEWYRVYGLLPYRLWNKIFLTEGWQDLNKYYPFRNALDANQNIYWDLPSMDYYSGLGPRRMDTWKGIFEEGIRVNSEYSKVSISSSSAKMLDLSGVRYVVTPYIINSETPLFIMATVSGQLNFYIYKNNKALPHAYIAHDYKTVSTYFELIKNLTDYNSYLPILEETVESRNYLDHSNEKINVVKNNDLEVEIEVFLVEQGLIILSDSYYPQWRAYIDNKETKIYKANLNQRAISAPSGYHKIKFSYQPLKIF